VDAHFIEHDGDGVVTNSVLVVGGAGYVGSHVCKALAQRGVVPVVFDNFTTGHRRFVRWGPSVEGDVRDHAAIVGALCAHRCSAVMHFAAAAYVGESVIEPAKYYANNVIGTIALLNAMRAAHCPCLVFSSTCAIFGEATTPIAEAMPLNPINPYGASKMMAERIIRDYGTAYGIRAICLRYFNACGADPEGELGELRDPETHLIPRAMMALLGHLHDFAVFGSDYPTPDGTAVRDYIHVLDLAEAHLSALRMLRDGGASDAFNLGTGCGLSVREVLQTIERITGARLPTITGPRRDGDPPILIADPSRAQQILGLQVSNSSIEQIVSSAWHWHSAVHPRANASFSPFYSRASRD
jgi:UDP-arabinose 4-epimerase